MCVQRIHRLPGLVEASRDFITLVTSGSKSKCVLGRLEPLQQNLSKAS
jgi:hypothetical protein